MEIMYMIAYDVYVCIFSGLIYTMLNCHCVQNKLICIMNPQQEVFFMHQVKSVTYFIKESLKLHEEYY